MIQNYVLINHYNLLYYYGHHSTFLKRNPFRSLSKDFIVTDPESFMSPKTPASNLWLDHLDPHFPCIYVVVLDPIGIGKIDPHFFYFFFLNMGSIFIKQFFERGNPEEHDFNPIAVSQEPRYHRYLRSTRFLLALSSQAQLPEPLPNAGANIYVPEFGLRA